MNTRCLLMPAALAAALLSGCTGTQMASTDAEQDALVAAWTTNCDRLGYQRGTQESLSCVMTQFNAWDAQQSRNTAAGMAMLGAGTSMMNNSYGWSAPAPVAPAAPRNCYTQATRTGQLETCY